ncbi:MULTISPECIES: helix-turn-helix transcriptional regulator [unclassified Streptomyces]|uniref:helix-turn-helix domain-containing protein n=2 Tax=Streptomyces TaxID=1883 RepID=UPI001011B6AA|nr:MULTISPECIES: helix-turn-helix transcriptional regulator [unclassified Streptomyces]NJA57508.1 helix-turn-helix transcriptional regulator [Streptomyces sp. NEAU-H3]WEH31608.1 helix-turn-helix transcriptional regulator [Streptomyces sp. AM 3-1-1]
MMVNRKLLDPTSSGAAAYGAYLRRLRDERGWSQEHLGDLLGCSGGHVSAVETGRRDPTQQFSARCDQVFGVGGEFVRRSAKLRNRPLLEGFPEYLECERTAVEIRTYETGVVAGLLQTPDYARVFEADAVRRGMATPEQAEERVKLLLERQRLLVRTPEPPFAFFVLDEGCLHIRMGSVQLMREQFDYLLSFAERPNSVLQVAPFATGARRSFRLPITILTMRDRSLVSYGESSHRVNLDRVTGSVAPRLAAYHQLMRDALPPADTVAMIHALRKGLA